MRNILLIFVTLVICAQAWSYDFSWSGQAKLVAEEFASARGDRKKTHILELGAMANPVAQQTLISIATSPQELPEIRAMAAQALIEQAAPDSIELFQKWLLSPDPEERKLAARAMGVFKQHKQSKTLIRLLGDVHWETRFEAIISLGVLKSSDAVTPMIERLDDPRTEVREAAARELRNLGAPQAALPLIAAFGDSSIRVALAAIESAVELDPNRALPAIIRLADTGNRKLRLGALSGILKISPLKGANRLVQHIMNSRDKERAAAESLLTESIVAQRTNTEFTKEICPRLIKLVIRNSASIETLLQTQDACVSWIKPAIDKVSAEKAQILLSVLLEYRPNLALPILIEEFSKTRLSRKFLIRSLGQTKNPKAATPLLQELVQKQSSAQRREILSALEKVALPESGIGDVVTPYLDDKDKETRQAAVRVLGKVQAKNRSQQLIALYDKEQGALRTTILEALAQLDDDSLHPFWQRILETGSQAHCRVAAAALGRNPNTKTVDILVAKFPKLKPYQQVLVVRLMGAQRHQTKSSKWEKKLRRIIHNSPSSVTRSEALRAIARGNVDEKWLFQRLRTLSGVEIAQIIPALRSRDSRPTLIRLALSQNSIVATASLESLAYQLADDPKVFKTALQVLAKGVDEGSAVNAAALVAMSKQPLTLEQFKQYKAIRFLKARQNLLWKLRTLPRSQQLQWHRELELDPPSKLPAPAKPTLTGKWTYYRLVDPAGSSLSLAYHTVKRGELLFARYADEDGTVLSTSPVEIVDTLSTSSVAP